MDVDLDEAAVRPLVQRIAAGTLAFTGESSYRTGQKARAGQSRNADSKLALQRRHIPSPVM
ncbi:hypothetical protein ACH4HG_36625 [Streptomyces coeruleorubidus]|uniref:hypothetical protein n=1 Tax=Streptomyces coeruleorubidus TaxID=116188 RepID=UPI001E3AC5BD|nr:hypothetical protein [Streptomyces bellus]